MSSKEEREKIMSDEDRVAACQARGKRCWYCFGKNLIETVTDRLFLCCNECAESDSKMPVVVTELPCVVCGFTIKSSMCAPEVPDEITTQNVNFMSFDEGAATKLAYGYGCHLDGNVYLIALCKTCTERKVEEGRLKFVYNYITNTEGVE